MPKDHREVIVLFPLLAQLQQRRLPRIRVHEIHDEGEQLSFFVTGAYTSDTPNTARIQPDAS